MTFKAKWNSGYLDFWISGYLHFYNARHSISLLWLCILDFSSESTAEQCNFCYFNCLCLAGKKMIFQSQFYHCSQCIQLSWIDTIAIWLQCHSSRDLLQLFLMTLIHYASSTSLLRYKQYSTRNPVNSAPTNLLQTTISDSLHGPFSQKLFNLKTRLYNRKTFLLNLCSLY